MGGNLCAGLLPLASLAQLVEQRTFNSWVVGSNPTGGTVGDAEVVEVQVCGTCISGFESSLPPQFALVAQLVELITSTQKYEQMWTNIDKCGHEF